MKKIAFLVFCLTSALCYSEELTWAEYCLECEKNGIEPKYENYEISSECGTCLVDDEEEIKRLFEESNEEEGDHGKK